MAKKNMLTILKKKIADQRQKNDECLEEAKDAKDQRQIDVETAISDTWDLVESFIRESIKEAK